MSKRIEKDYFGIPYIVSVILSIIMPTSYILGFVTRFAEGKWLAGIIRLITGWNIIWIADIICMLFTHHILKIF